MGNYHNYIELIAASDSEGDSAGDSAEKADAAKATDTPSTAATASTTLFPTTGLATTTNFRKQVWLFEKGYGSLEGMDAFNNGERLLRNVDKLSVAVVSVMGRLTPICGEFWNRGAAEVFCKDAGAQVQQNWTASYVSCKFDLLLHSRTYRLHSNLALLCYAQISC